MLRVRTLVVVSVVCLFVAGAAGCAPAFKVPAANADFDYQIGGVYPPPAGVAVVSRDRDAAPAAGVYNVCYVNGFQAQTEDEQWWLTNHPTLVLRDAAGQPVKDTDWNELILDISTSTKRTQLAAIVGGWIAKCGTDGFQGVEVDNLDTYARAGNGSNGLPRLTPDHAVAYVRLLSDRAHGAHLALGQKNAADLVPRRTEMGSNFAIAEECNHYNECDSYTAGYGANVFVIEYARSDFDKGCRDWPGLSIVLRDRDVQPAGSPDYVRAAC